MIYSILAEIVVFIHFLFIIFAVIGAVLVLKWRWVIYPHLISAFWAAMVVTMGWICPLTPLENHLRRAAGEAGYEGGFIEHYLLPVIYPPGLTREVQILLGVGVILINLILYAIVVKRYLKKRG
ncbi:MAG: DUF2784 domain-containing protein [Balneolaceae bacterium]|nr:DUF2784 domain-containing protein [Balneolaceae bacterium]